MVVTIFVNIYIIAFPPTRNLKNTKFGPFFSDHGCTIFRNTTSNNKVGSKFWKAWILHQFQHILIDGETQIAFLQI
jgi:hypothetical protein